MSNQRAQPALDLTIPDNKPTQPSRNDADRFLLRTPKWVKALVNEAADHEGISMNLWIQRAIAEMGKLARDDDWRTIPVDDEPRIFDPNYVLPKEPEPASPSQPWINPNPGIPRPNYPTTPFMQPYIISGTRTYSSSGTADPGSVTYNWYVDANGDYFNSDGKKQDVSFTQVGHDVTSLVDDPGSSNSIATQQVEMIIDGSAPIMLDEFSMTPTDDYTITSGDQIVFDIPKTEFVIPEGDIPEPM